jgi:negative regulator of flagellin synthesis FlgM
MAIGNVKNQPNSPLGQAPKNSNGNAADALSNETAQKAEGSQSAQSASRAAASRAAFAGYEKVAKNTPSVKDATNVQISQKAKDLSLIQKTLNETPDVREDKIAHFKSLIASGKYKPDAGKIADGIMKEAVMDELSKTPNIALEE